MIMTTAGNRCARRRASLLPALCESVNRSSSCALGFLPLPLFAPGRPRCIVVWLAGVLAARGAVVVVLVLRPALRLAGAGGAWCRPPVAGVRGALAPRPPGRSNYCTTNYEVLEMNKQRQESESLVLEPRRVRADEATWGGGRGGAGGGRSEKPPASSSYCLVLVLSEQNKQDNVQ